MVADNWINRNPFISKLIFSALTIIGSFAVVKATWSREDKIADKEALDRKVDRVEFKSEQIRVDSRLNLKVDKEDFNKLDIKVETQRVEWREDQKEILRLIREISK